MATDEEKEEAQSGEDKSPDSSESDSTELARSGENAGLDAEQDEVTFDGGVPAQLGTAKYVQAAFFGAGVLGAFLTGKILAAVWNALADWPAAVRAVPSLLSYAEDERSSFTMPIGALVGIVGVVYAVRKSHVRQWADEVATELYKVHWPDREVVTNGTIVVLVASVFATIYIGLLDRLWSFVTALIYGA